MILQPDVIYKGYLIFLSRIYFFLLHQNLQLKFFYLLEQFKGVNKVIKRDRMKEIWNNRNKVVFNIGIVNPIEILSLTGLKGWLWFKYKIKIITFSYSDWYFILVKCLGLIIISCNRGVIEVFSGDTLANYWYVCMVSLV